MRCFLLSSDSSSEIVFPMRTKGRAQKAQSVEDRLGIGGHRGRKDRGGGADTNTHFIWFWAHQADKFELQ